MKKFFLFILVLVVLGGGFFLWKNRYEYFFQQDEESLNGQPKEESFLEKIKINLEKKESAIEGTENKEEGEVVEKEAGDDPINQGSGSSETEKSHFFPKKNLLLRIIAQKNAKNIRTTRTNMNIAEKFAASMTGK